MNELEKSIYLELFSPVLSKSDRTKLAIVRAAIRCYAQAGLDGVTYDVIAKEAKVTRPLVQRYFPARGDLFLLMVKYIRANFQHLAIQALRQELSPEKQLDAYVRSTFDWVRDYFDHMAVWLYFFYRAAVDEEYKEIHSDLVSMGFERIKAIIREGKKRKLFRCTDVSTSAKFIQVNITGALVALTTEKGPYNLKEMRERTVKMCSELANR